MEQKENFQMRMKARLTPDYYAEFACTGGACRNSCCRSSWNIDINKKDYMTLRRVCKSEQAKALFERGVKRQRGAEASEQIYARFVTKDGACAFLNDEGLCALQLECGYKALPTVCQEFPRSITPPLANGAEERSCSIGCEAVLALLYERHEGLGFVLDDLPPSEHKNVVLSAKRLDLHRHFGELRELCIDILQDRRLPLPRRLLLLGVVLRDIEAENLDIPAFLAQKRALVDMPEIHEQICRMPGNRAFFIMNNIQSLLTYDFTDEAMRRLREDCCAIFGLTTETALDALEFDLTRYQEAEDHFAAAYGDLAYFFENMMVNTFFNQKLPLYGKNVHVWDNYIAFCNLYSRLRFMCICCCQEDSGKERLFDVLTHAARTLLHSPITERHFVNTLQENENTTLADMAILVCG